MPFSSELRNVLQSALSVIKVMFPSWTVWFLCLAPHWFQTLQQKRKVIYWSSMTSAFTCTQSPSFPLHMHSTPSDTVCLPVTQQPVHVWDRSALAHQHTVQNQIHIFALAMILLNPNFNVFVIHLVSQTKKPRVSIGSSPLLTSHVQFYLPYMSHILPFLPIYPSMPLFWTLLISHM